MAAPGHPGPGQGRGHRRPGQRAGAPEEGPQVIEVERDLDRTSKALKELAIENTLLRGKVDGA